MLTSILALTVLTRGLAPAPPSWSRLRIALARWSPLLLSLSERMLSERLKELEAQGVVSREVLAGPPVRVEYRLTGKGQALSGVLEEIGRWAEKWVATKPARARKHPLA